MGHHPVILIPGTESRNGDSFGKRLHDVMLRFLTEVMYPSILDLLVDFLPEARPGLLGLSALTREFLRILGRPVDLAVKPALKPLIRAAIVADACVLYAA